MTISCILATYGKLLTGFFIESHHLHFHPPYPHRHYPMLFLLSLSVRSPNFTLLSLHKITVLLRLTLIHHVHPLHSTTFIQLLAMKFSNLSTKRQISNVTWTQYQRHCSNAVPTFWFLFSPALSIYLYLLEP